MSQFVRICPRCHTQNPEYEHVCTSCGQFIAMESPVIVEEKAEQNSSSESNPSTVSSRPIAEDAATQRFVLPPAVPAIYLELQAADNPIFTVKSGWFLGQAHPESKAEIQIDTKIEGSEFVHRRHCRFLYKDKHWYVQALDQKRYQGQFTNPTKINDKALAADKARQIKEGDILRLSGLSFQVKVIA